MVVAGEPAARVYFHTLGCPKNDADSRYLRRVLLRAGAEVVERPEDCTHVVINTCGFIQDAKEESIAAILESCRAFPRAQVIVMGCLVERYRDELIKGIPEVSEWFGIGGETMALCLARTVLGRTVEDERPGALGAGNGKSYAYVKISDGCDEKCTFCAIPNFKGSYESVPTAEILEEADRCLAEGARELILVGQDTSRWRGDGLDLIGLVDLLGEDQRLRRVRVMYLQPTRLGERFLRSMLERDKLCAYLDVPFQHSEEEILRRMGRRGHGAGYLELVRRARLVVPEVHIRSTFIVGFPGEEEQHFEGLLDFVEAAEFEYGGAFVYSPEEGTEAASLGPRVPTAVATRRLNKLTELIYTTGERRRARLVGTEVEVIVDESGGDSVVEGVVAVGRTEGQAPDIDGVTFLKGGAVEMGPGDVVRARIVEVVGCDLVGEVVAS